MNIKSVDGPECPISKTRAWAWMKNLGFSYESHVKNIYYDGHDRADVLEYRSIFFSIGFWKAMSNKGFFLLGVVKAFSSYQCCCLMRKPFKIKLLVVLIVASFIVMSLTSIKKC